ncbi:MAG: lipid A export permease/ATP-binding protein MsbA [Betaproteobacteria bacterium RIFCSPLOWO2_12_FULL_67_28]|nr:MAG: lipid A export permease/ATP-binding protein MsbA [Betaproteobacteria bacterium RIFCSPLOWO2_12_FULL_67_28]
MNPATSSRELYFRLLQYVRPHAKAFGLAVVGMIAAAATEPLFPALMKPLLDGGFGQGSAPALQPQWFAAALLGIFLARGLLSFASSYFMAWVGNRVILDLRAAMFARLLRLPNRFFDDHSSGVLLSRIAYDVGGVTSAATTVLTIVVKDSIAVIGLLAWLCYLNWKLTLIALAVGPAIALVVRLFSRRLRRMAREAQHAMGDLVQVLDETIECQRVVKIFGGQDYEMRRFERANQKLRGFNMRQTIPAAATVPITQFLAAGVLAIIVYIALEESLSSRTTVGEFASFITAMLMLLAPLKRLTDVNAPLQRGLAAAESVFGLIDAPVEEDRGTLRLERARGAIDCQNVSFTYPTRDEPALSGVSLAIRPGETVALVGGSGGGKTTLVNLLPRFYVPTGGRILLDGNDIQGLALESLRGNLALVSQDVVLFNDSIRANIAYGRMGSASEAEVIAAAEAAHAMEFIRGTPEGLGTLIGENGLRLSGGQRQRLAIARALLKDAPVLILDEATSALDSESERLVQSALEVLMRGRTTIVIAHRLSTIERADRIVVLERGRIAETGTHAQLLAREGVYAKLYRIQFASEA